LKENFDRFNFALYKEKQMADFRRWFTALAVLALMVGAASAQVGVAVGTGSGSLSCNAVGNQTQLRPEGYTELAGDILITCTGGPGYSQGTAVPTTNVTIYLSPTVPVTSRLLPTKQSPTASEALLIIDDAGNTTLPAGVTGFGPQATQSLCTVDQEQALGGTKCNLMVGSLPGVGGGPYAVALPGPGNPNNLSNTGASGVAQNVFQGKVGDFGVNTVTFYSVPVLPPNSAGVSRTFRITNIRVPAVGTANNQFWAATIAVGSSQVLPIGGSVNIGVTSPPLTAAVKPSANNAFQQCTAQTLALSATLVYTEGFATAFKTRVVPGGSANNTTTTNAAWSAEATNTGSPYFQNTPGGLYGGFAANSESGFVFAPLTATVSSVTYTAGLADYGTRLKAVFYNIPAGLTLYVSTTSTGSAPVPVGGTSALPYAVLVGANSGEATPWDGTKDPIVGPLTSPDGFNVIALSANAAGAATAVWEVTNSNYSAQDVMNFNVYISYAPTAATTANPFGTPITDLPLGALVNDVQMSFAPEPGGGTFSAANASSGSGPIPRFAVIKTYEGRWTTVNLCQTSLLYPFVTGAAGFDTGIAVANTSSDPFGTVHQVGSCTLYGYGLSIAAAGNTVSQPVINGCDTIANPVGGTNCFPSVPTGQVGSVMASGVFSGFQGYVIAVCNFQYAHGYAAVTDLGLRNLWSSYLALELSPAGIGAFKRGFGIETLAH
jgi:hypothetical protein